jgi:hypothetical protein
MAAIENVRGTVRFGEIVPRESPDYFNVGDRCMIDQVAEWMADEDAVGMVAPSGAVRDTLRSPTAELCLDRGWMARWKRERAETMRAQANRGWKVTGDEWLTIQRGFDFRCVYCDATPSRLTRDHVKAIAVGGRNVWRNILPACRSCNSRKNVKSLALWFGAEPAALEALLRRVASGRSKAARLRREAKIDR